MKNAYAETATAARYDSARHLPAETKALWLNALRSEIPSIRPAKILDLGCGTGRFTSALAQTFNCSAAGIEPSEAMLDIARSHGAANIEWKPGNAERIPIADETVGLVFMSQVFHHFTDRNAALDEVFRVLPPGGYVAIRNGTLEHNSELVWLRFFPEAYEIEQQRTPSAEEIKDALRKHAFVLVTHRVIKQLFASSSVEYFDKISQRALSALVAISDEEFAAGLDEFRSWTNSQPRDVGIHEPVDLFIFQKPPSGPRSES
jgi:ubiquinone/menaquinone biosynthesis C-methylase UbiE